MLIYERPKCRLYRFRLEIQASHFPPNMGLQYWWYWDFPVIKITAIHPVHVLSALLQSEHEDKHVLKAAQRARLRSWLEIVSTFVKLAKSRIPHPLDLHGSGWRCQSCHYTGWYMRAGISGQNLWYHDLTCTISNTGGKAWVFAVFIQIKQWFWLKIFQNLSPNLKLPSLNKKITDSIKLNSWSMKNIWS